MKRCPLIGTKRTYRVAPHMSAFGAKRTSAGALHMSAFDPKRTLCTLTGGHGTVLALRYRKPRHAIGGAIVGLLLLVVVTFAPNAK